MKKTIGLMLIGTVFAVLFAGIATKVGALMALKIVGGALIGAVMLWIGVEMLYS